MVRGWRKDGKYVKRMVQRWCMDGAQGVVKGGTKMVQGWYKKRKNIVKRMAKGWSTDAGQAVVGGYKDARRIV